MKAKQGFLEISSLFNTAATNILTGGFYPEMTAAIDSMYKDLFVYGFPGETDEYNPGNENRRVRAIQARQIICDVLSIAVANSLNMPGNALQMSKEDAIHIQLLFSDYSKDEILQGLEDLALSSIMYKWKIVGTPTNHNKAVMHPYNMYQKIKTLIGGYIYRPETD